MSALQGQCRPLCFFVAGVPVTQGSKTVMLSRHRDLAKRKPIMLDANRNQLHSWRDAVGAEARRRCSTLTAAAVDLSLVFLLPKPVSRPKRDTVPIAKRSGDLDKLMRAVMDALTGVYYCDDAQVSDARLKKRWAPPGEQPGVWVWVGEATP